MRPVHRCITIYRPGHPHGRQAVKVRANERCSALSEFRLTSFPSDPTVPDTKGMVHQILNRNGLIIRHKRDGTAQLEAIKIDSSVLERYVSYRLCRSGYRQHPRDI